MPAKLYMDVHVPASLTSALRRRGLDVLTAQDDGATEFSDEDLLDRATHLDRVLYTQDSDFHLICSKRQTANTPFKAVVFSHQLGPGIGQIVEDLDLILQLATEDELMNQMIYLPLKP